MCKVFKNSNAFCKEYSQAVSQLPGVTGVTFIGSIANGTFIPGRSDLDIFVFGNRLPHDTKRRARALIIELNVKYKLGLEEAPCQHPTPFFIDSSLSREVYRLLVGRHEFKPLRSLAKRVAPPHHVVWRVQERVGL
jgi:predicted nucleotidyltransferase